MKKLMYLSLLVGSLIYAAVAIKTEDNPSVKKAETKKEGVVFVKNNDNIDIVKKTEKVEAKLEFNESKTEPKKYENYSLVGEYKTKKTIDGKVQIDIDWQKVKKDKTEVLLNEPFSSTLKTTTLIKKDSKFKAKGNLDQLNLVLNQAKEKAEKEALLINGSQAETKTVNSNTSTAETKKGALNNDLATVTMGANSDRYKDTSTGANSNPTYDTGTTFKEPEITLDTATSCQNEISNGTVQFKKLVNNICMAIGSPVPIYETPKGCTPKIDYKTNEVFVATKKVADMEGVETTVESCKINYDTPYELQSTYSGCGLVFRKDLKAQVQQEQLFFTYDREDVNIGSCTDSELTYAVDTFQEWNKTCSPLIDYDNKTVKYAFREVAQIDGSLVEVAPCKFDETKLYDLNTTYEGCDVLDDFTNKISIQKERFYYIFENKKVYLGECQESNISFPHYLTADTCEFQRLDDNHIVYNKRVAYKDVNGIVHYLTACKPSEDGSIELTTLKCGYEHDFFNNQSYPMSKQIFNDTQTSEVIEVSTCSKDPQNFPHQQEHCSWEYDDENKYTNEWVKKYFVDTNSGETIFLDISGANAEGCVKGSPVPYVQSSENILFIKSLGFQRLAKKTDGTYHFYGDETKTIDVTTGVVPTLKGGSQNITSTSYKYNGACVIGINVSYSSCIGGTIAQQNASYITQTFTDGETGQCKGDATAYYTKKTCDYYDYWEEVGEYQLQTKYLRADGTYFMLPAKTIYRIIK